MTFDRALRRHNPLRRLVEVVVVGLRGVAAGHGRDDIFVK